jgi:hypothetical protein
LVKCITYLCLITIIISCKKKTDIEVKVYNPYLDEYTSGATIAIIERKGTAGGGIFAGSASCKEIATAVTDVNGVAVFNDTKLKRREGYEYYPVIKEAWGTTNNYPCGGYNGVLLDKGKTNTIIKSDRSDGGDIKIQYSNLFNPAIIGDSIYIIGTRISGYDPELNHVVGETGGFLGRMEKYDFAKPSYPNLMVDNGPKLNGRFRLYIFKKKLGVITTTIDTIKAYPNETKIVQVNW